MGEKTERTSPASRDRNRDRSADRSLAAVVTAFSANVAILVAKIVAAIASGSASMLSEAVHSAADGLNQGLLWIGLRESRKQPDERHPYGYGRARWFWALLSATGILFIGCGATVANGIRKLLEPAGLERLDLAFAVLAAAFLFEGISLVVGVRTVARSARDADTGFFAYLGSGPDPVGVAVVLEDGLAVVGVILATAAILATRATGDPRWDAAGSIAIGLLLGAAALFLMNRNRRLLIGEALPAAERERIVEVLVRSRAVGGVHDVKTTLLDPDRAHFKAELDFDGRVLAERWLRDQDLAELRRRAATDEGLATALAEHAQSVVEAVGREIDDLERKIREVAPDVRHIDLEAN